MKIGERVRLIRESKKISQAELAQGIHISKSLMNRLEKGSSTMSIQYVISIAEYLGVTPQDILCDIFVFKSTADSTLATEIKTLSEKLPPKYQQYILDTIKLLLSTLNII